MVAGIVTELSIFPSAPANTSPSFIGFEYRVIFIGDSDLYGISCVLIVKISFLTT